MPHAKIIIIKTMKTLIWLTAKFLYLHWFKLSWEGTQNLPREKSYFIASNHTSHLDYGAIAIALEKHTKEVYALGAKDYFFNNSIKSWFFQTFCNVIPFNRTGNFLSGLRRCQQIFQEGSPVVIFPEGTRSTTGKIQAFQTGLSILALKSNVTIVPVYIDETYQALPKGYWFPRRHPIRVFFGVPLNLCQYQTKTDILTKREIYEKIASDAHTSVMALQTQAVNNYQESPAKVLI